MSEYSCDSEAQTLNLCRLRIICKRLPIHSPPLTKLATDWHTKRMAKIDIRKVWAHPMFAL